MQEDWSLFQLFLPLCVSQSFQAGSRFLRRSETSSLYIKNSPSVVLPLLGSVISIIIMFSFVLSHGSDKQDNTCSSAGAGGNWLAINVFQLQARCWDWGFFEVWKRLDPDRNYVPPQCGNSLCGDTHTNGDWVTSPPPLPPYMAFSSLQNENGKLKIIVSQTTLINTHG